MTTTTASTRSAARRVANGIARHAAPDDLRAKAEHTVSELAHDLRETVDKQGKLAKRQARTLYRDSSAAIKHHPWRAIGIALLVGAVAGGMIALTRRE